MKKVTYLIKYLEFIFLIDSKWYKKEYLEKNTENISPIRHYILKGRHSGCFLNLKQKKKNSKSRILSTKYFLNCGKLSLSPKAPVLAYTPKISVIVPNYNDAKFLEQRLESIYNQSYKNIEVILLDDDSSDLSLNILRKYQKKYPGITKLFINEKNSGGPYYQWKKGLELSTGDLIWIAEADDYSELNFLSSLVPAFCDRSVLLAFCPSYFILNDKVIASTSSICSDCIPEKSWNESFKISSNIFVRDFLSRRNVIINVSSCVFRKPDLKTIDPDDWYKLSICGDWIFYLNLILGGYVYFEKSYLNLYRIHKQSTSLNAQKTFSYYREHFLVMSTILDKYRISYKSFYLFEKVLRDKFKNEQKKGDLDNLIDFANLRNKFNSKKPNILISGYAFCSGGGETFPIYLANGLRRKGYPVTFLNFCQKEENSGIRKKLINNIGIIDYTSADCNKLCSIIKDLSVDIVHTDHLTCDRFIARTKLKFNGNFKHVITMHGMYELLDVDDFNYIYPELHLSCDKWVFTAKKNLANFIKTNKYSENLFLNIPNSVFFKSEEKLDRRNFGIDSKSFLVCLCSRAIESKGWKVAISAVKYLRENCGLFVDLMLIGDGPLYSELKESKTLPSYVHLMGFRSNVVDFYEISDLGLLPSTFPGESYPLVAIACLLTGKPFMCSDIGECKNLIKSNEIYAGDLIPIKDGKILAEDIVVHLKNLILNKPYYNQLINNAKIVSEKFSFDKFVNSYISTYLNLYDKIF